MRRVAGGWPQRSPYGGFPEADILVHGTADPCADVATQARFEAETVQPLVPRAKSRTRRGWGLVRGELMTFDDPEERLPRLDRLEGYRSGSPSLYSRVLVPVYLDASSWPAWVYTIGESLSRAHVQRESSWPY